MRDWMQNLRRSYGEYRLERRSPRLVVEELEARCLLAGGFTEFPVPTASAAPAGITDGPDGALWFTEPDSDGMPHKIGRITTGGTITEFNGITPFSGPNAIT